MAGYVLTGLIASALVSPSARANDLAEALGYTAEAIGEHEVSMYREQMSAPDEAALALLVARDVEIGRPLESYDCSSSLVDQPSTLRSSHEDKWALRECRRLMWKRAALPGFRTLGPAPLAPRELERIIASAEAETGVPERLLRIIIEFKSGYRPGVVSEAGHLGLMQLHPSHLELFGIRHGNLLDAEENIRTGARYLRALVERGGDLFTGLTAYHEPRQTDVNRLLANRDTKWFVREVYAMYLAEVREFPTEVGAEAMAKVFTWWD